MAQSEPQFHMNFDTIYSSPDLFPASYNANEISFVRMDRNAYHNSIFCDLRIKPADKTPINTAFSILNYYLGRLPQETPGISYIFHMAHGGSTLLARAIDRPDQNIVCREPYILRQLAVEANRHAGSEPPEEWETKLKITTRLLSRRYIQDAPAIIKANVPVNFILPDLQAQETNAPSIILYYGLEKYLLSILRTPNHVKWAAGVINEMNPSIRLHAPLESKMTIAQAAGSLWLAQIRIYANALAEHSNIASLHSEDLFNQPDEAISKSFAHFNQPQSEEVIKEITSSDLFAKYSKNPDMEFTNDQRKERQAQLRTQLKPQLDQAFSWVEKAIRAAPLPDSLPNALMSSPDLLER